MWTKQYEHIVRGHCRGVASDAALDPHTPLALLGIDSIEIVSLIVDLEDELDLELPEQAITPETFATLGTLWDMLCQQLNTSG